MRAPRPCASRAASGRATPVSRSARTSGCWGSASAWSPTGSPTRASSDQRRATGLIPRGPARSDGPARFCAPERTADAQARVPGGLLSAPCGKVAGMSRAEGTFDIDRFDTQDPHDDRDGVKLARAHISKTFHGDLVGTSETDIITVSTENPAAYVGIERVDGTLHGRKGGLVLQHEAGGPDGEHSYTLDYEL